VVVVVIVIALRHPTLSEDVFEVKPDRGVKLLMTELHDLLDYDNEHDHRFAEHEHTKKRRTSTSGC